MIISNVTLPVKPDKITDIVDAVNGAIQATNDIYAAVDSYEKKANSFKGKSAYSRFNINRWDNIDQMTRKIHAEGWRYLLERFESFMSTSERNEWEKAIEAGDTPEFTQEAAIETMRSFIERAPDDITARIRDCFESMRPRFREELKTNQANAFKIGKRYIYKNCVYGWCGSLTPHGEKFCSSLDLAFNLLDGKGVPKYPSDLSTILRMAVHEGGRDLETDYFKLKWYENGNVHIEFKRMDLVGRLNQIGSGGKFELREAS